MTYIMIPRPWIQKYMDDVRFMAGCKKRSDVIQDLLNDYDDYLFNRLPADVKYEIDMDLYAKYNNTGARMADAGLWNELKDLTDCEDQDRRSMTREWWMNHEED